jgi:hypothetical protein
MTHQIPACNQDVNDVLNLSYVQNTAEDIVSFDEKQKHVYSLQAHHGKKSSLIDQGANEALQVLTQGSLNAILINRLILVALITMGSLSFLLSLLMELLQDLTGGMSSSSFAPPHKQQLSQNTKLMLLKTSTHAHL